MDNMVMAIIPREEAELVMSALIEVGNTSTVLDTKGGVFRRSQKTLFIVVDDQNLDAILKIIEANCKVVLGYKAEGIIEGNNELSNNAKRIGGTIVFVWKLDRKFNF